MVAQQQQLVEQREKQSVGWQQQRMRLRVVWRPQAEAVLIAAAQGAWPGCCGWGCAVQAVSLGKGSEIQSLAALSISSIFSTLFFLSFPSISTVTGKDFNTLMEFI